MKTWFLGFDPSAVKAAKAVDPYAYGNRINGLITGLQMAKLKPQPLREILGILVRLDAPSPELQKRQSEAENHIDMAAGNADVRNSGTAEEYRQKAIGTLNRLRAETERFINDQKKRRRGKTAKVVKAEYWVNPLKVRFAISQLEAVIPDEVNSPKTLQVIAQRCDDIVGKLPTRENPGMEDTAFALKKAAGEFRIASRLLNDPARFDASYTRAKQYVHAALIKVSGIPGAHRSLEDTAKAVDLKKIQEAAAHIRKAYYATATMDFSSHRMSDVMIRDMAREVNLVALGPLRKYLPSMVHIMLVDISDALSEALMLYNRHEQGKARQKIESIRKPLYAAWQQLENWQ